MSKESFSSILNGWYQTLLINDKRDNSHLESEIVLKKWVSLYGAEVLKIRKAYTEERSNIDFSLVQHAKSTFAYLLAFHLPNFSRMYRFLERLDKSTHLKSSLDKQNVQIYDIGCGTGAFAQAFQFYFRKNQNLTLVDPNKNFLHIAKSILELSFPKIQNLKTIQCKAHELEFNSSKMPTVLLIGNVLNQIKMPRANFELFLRKLTELVKNPSLIMMVEPATEKSAKDMMALRNNLVEQGFLPLYPCPHSQICPLTDTRDRCYSDFALPWLEPMRIIDLKTGLKRQILSGATYCFASPSFPLNLQKKEKIAVLVGQPLSKGKKIALLCTEKGIIDRKNNEKKLRLRGERTSE